MDNLYDRPAVSEITTMSRHTLARHIEKGDFPKPIKRIGSKQLWSESQLETWLNDQDEEKEAA